MCRATSSQSDRRIQYPTSILIIRGPTSPRPVSSSAVSALALHSPTHTQLPSATDRDRTEASSSSRDAWTNLTALLDVLNHTTVFGPLAAAVDTLNWFIREHEEVVIIRDEYEALRTQLEALFGDLLRHISGDMPPTMTTSILNVCGAIEIELAKVYDTQDRNTISRYMQANKDLDRIMECYRRIQGHLERLADAQLDRINPSLSACYDSAEANVVHRRECAPRTREQVLSELKSWTDNPEGEKVCWINGMAGTGKTTIATSLCYTLNKTHELGASFFCARSVPACRDVKLILPTIAYQLARFSSPFRGALLRVLDRDPDVHTKVPQVQFQRMILEPLRTVVRSLPSIVVVIDALDECDDGNGVEQILEVLLESLTALPIKFLVSSRPEHHIRNKISKSALNTHMVLHQLDEKMVKADIETYLRTELASLSISLAEDQLETLVEGAGVLFIFAATVVRYIGEGDSLERLQTVLAASPESRQHSSDIALDIDDLYTTILVSALNNRRLSHLEKQRMELVLHSVVLAQEPLTIDALAGLLGNTSAQVVSALKPLWSVLHVSGPNTTDRVSTLHASFPDYILNSTRSGKFATNSVAHHGKLAELCFRRISGNSTQFNICNLVSSNVFDEDAPGLEERVKQNIPLDLLYACQYWATHLNLSDALERRRETLHDFLSKRLLLWLEVLNLSKRVKRAVAQIEVAIVWLRAVESAKYSISLARDALRFVTMFATSPVCRSTPHLYVSMLSAWPDSQPISEFYIRQTKNRIKIKGIESTERQLSLLGLIPMGSEVKCIAYASNGAFFASGTRDHKVQIWDATSCQMVVDQICGHTDIVQAIAISPDGTQICSGSRDCTIRIWDSQSGLPITGPLEGHTNWVNSLAYSSDARWLVSGSRDGTVRVWDAYTWEAKGDPLNGNNGKVVSVAFSPDSSMIAAGSGSLIYLWDPFNGQTRSEPLKGHSRDITTLAFTPNGSYLTSGSEDYTIRIWDVNTGQTAAPPLQEHLSVIDCITVSPNGKLLASAARDNTIRIWDTKSWTTRSLLQHAGVARSVSFSTNGSRLVSGSMDGNIRVWEVSDASDELKVENRSHGHSDSIRSVAFSPCGAYIVSGSDDMTVRVWDAQNGRPVGDLLKGHNEWVTWIGVSADGNQIFSASTDRMIQVWDRQTGQPQYTIGPIETDGKYVINYQEFWPAVYLFDDRRVVCGSKSGRIYIWENDRLAYELTGHSDAVYSLAVSPDGQSIASGDDDGNLAMWNTGAGEIIFGPFKVHTTCIYSIAFSSDGSLVASGSHDQTIGLWSPHTESQVGDILRGHTDEVRCVVFSPQGKHLASGSADMTVRLWDVASGQSIAVYKGHTDLVYSVAFSPDGARIASGSGDMTIRIWNTTVPDEALASTESQDRTSRSGSIIESNDDLTWTMDESGWVQDNEHRLLLWVPPDLRSVLLRSHNEILISREGCIELDLSDASIGETWAACYKPL